MSSASIWLRCLAEAVAAHGSSALLAGVPFGECLHLIATHAWDRLRDEAWAHGPTNALLATAQLSTDEAAVIATDLSADRHPNPIARPLYRLLVVAPAVVRRGLRHPADPTGDSLPLGWTCGRAEDLLPLLPNRAPCWQPGDRPVPRRRLLDLLGVGPFAELWLAQDDEISRRVVLKFIVDRKLAALFRRDARRFEQVDGAAQHPGLVTLRQRHAASDGLCLEYEHIESATLTAAIVAGRSLEGPARAERAARTIARLARVVGHCHRLDPPLIHRDLKPSNVLVTARADGEHDLRVGDLATGAITAERTLDRERRKAISSAEAQAARGCGCHTPLYASPQQARGMKADPRDDVYALGVLWSQLLSGDVLKGRPGGKDWTRQLPENGDVLKLLAACCERDPVRRPADAQALAEQLTALLAARGPSAILTVAPRGGDHASLAAAVRAAPAGARIVVRPGTYTDGIVLDKPVEIVAEGKPGEVIVESQDTCLVMQADHASVRGLTLRCQNPNGLYFAVDIARGRLLLEFCDITCASLAGVAIHGGQAQPTLRRCVVHHCHESGVFVYDHGKGRIEHCTLSHNRLSAIEIKTGGNPILRHCTLRDSTDGSGIYVYENGRGAFEDCEVFGHARSGVRVKDGSTPTFRRCTVRDGRQSGVYFSDGAGGAVVQCEIAGNQYANVEIKSGANPTIRDCRIHGSQQGGVFVYEQGHGTLVGCDIYANRLAGVEVKDNSDTVVERCIIRDSVEGGGFFSYDEGKGTVTDCDIHGNKCAGVEIREKADPIVRKCRVHSSREGSGGFVWDNSRGTIEDCEFYGNKLAGITVRQASEPAVRDCRFHDNGEAGIFVYQGGKGTYSGCDVWANQLAGIEVREEGEPNVIGCRIRDGKASGVFVYDKGRGRISDCEVFGHALSNVEIKKEGDPVIAGCRIHDAGTNGAYVYEQGKGTIEGCEIFDCGLSGIRIQQEGDPTVRGCTIRGTKRGNGVLVQDDGRGTLAHCTITANAEAGVQISSAGTPLVRDCRITGNTGVGVRLEAGSRGSVTDCDVTGNTGGPWAIDPATQTLRGNNRE